MPKNGSLQVRLSDKSERDKVEKENERENVRCFADTMVAMIHACFL